MAGIPGRLWRKYQIQTDFMGYVCSIGVRMGSNVRLYSGDPGMFGSEPFLITLGDNVYITAGVRFITHDGGTLILRKEVPDLDYRRRSLSVMTFTSVWKRLSCRECDWDRCVIGASAVVTKDIP